MIIEQKNAWNPYFYSAKMTLDQLLTLIWPSYWLWKPPNLDQLLTSQHICVCAYRLSEVHTQAIVTWADSKSSGHDMLHALCWHQTFLNSWLPTTSRLPSWLVCLLTSIMRALWDCRVSLEFPSWLLTSTFKILLFEISQPPKKVLAIVRKVRKVKWWLLVATWIDYFWSEAQSQTLQQNLSATIVSFQQRAFARWGSLKTVTSLNKEARFLKFHFLLFGDNELKCSKCYDRKAKIAFRISECCDRLGKRQRENSKCDYRLGKRPNLLI